MAHSGWQTVKTKNNQHLKPHTRVTMASFDGFEHPSSFEDRRWIWRKILQSKRSQESCTKHLINHCNFINKNNKDDIDIIMNSIDKNCLKLGCPQHSLMASIIEAGYTNVSNLNISNHCLCNGHSSNCDIIHFNNNTDNLSEIGRWSLFELGLSDNDLNRAKTGHIEMRCKIGNRNGNRNGNGIGNEEFNFAFDIMRCFDDAFRKRFRPGSYIYDGKEQRTKPTTTTTTATTNTKYKKSKSKNKNKNKSKNNKANNNNKSKGKNSANLDVFNTNNDTLLMNIGNNNTVVNSNKPFRWNTKANQLGTWVCCLVFAFFVFLYFFIFFFLFSSFSKIHGSLLVSVLVSV